MQAIAETRVALQAVEPKAQAATAGVTETTGVAAKIQLEREAIDRRIQQNGNRLQALQNAWQTLAGDKQSSDAALTEAVAGLRKDYEIHQSAEQKLHQADTLLTRTDCHGGIGTTQSRAQTDRRGMRSAESPLRGRVINSIRLF
jgi:uncharacterized protein YeeX (DUF496 family)